jgi:hypothetical protein
MKMFRRLLMTVFCGVAIASCFDPPVYPAEPEIVFKSLNYVEVPDLPTGEVTSDSLILVVRFKDGDGNLGLSPNEISPPFNDRWYYLKSKLDPALNPDCSPYANENKCFYISAYKTEFDKYIDFADRSTGTPPYDTLPDFVKPYNCENWEVVRDQNDQVIDQLYFELNSHYSNIFVEFQTKNGDNTYTAFNWSDFLTYPSCEIQGFNGRFPLLSEPGAGESPLEGEIRYSMPSPFFKIIFGAKTIRLRVYIEDRALNKSNEIYTNDFNF